MDINYSTWNNQQSSSKMATKTRNGGLQHASSLGNIASSKSPSHVNFRSYDSEDENMGRIRASHSSLPRTSVYSKGDIREQYCLSDRQLSSIEPPRRRERFFGCLSGRSNNQSFLGVCVGRRAPSDENLADYAPVYKYPRYPPPGSASNLFMHEDDTESSYFRRKPTSFLSHSSNGLSRSGSGGMTPTGSDPKRYTWLSAADEEAVRLEGPRSICPDINVVGPYIVGSPAYPGRTEQQPYLSQSSEHLNGGSAYRCPAHTRLQSSLANNNVPKNAFNNDGAASQSSNEPPTAPRIKHVSFARSHTLTSFDEAAAAVTQRQQNQHQQTLGHVHYGQATAMTPLQQQNITPAISNRPQQQPFNRLGTPTRSQERLIGGKKPTITMQPSTVAAQLILQQASLQMPPFGHSTATASPMMQQTLQQQQQDLFVVEKIKRNVMKTQATQTDQLRQQQLLLQQQQQGINPLTLSPRTSQRVSTTTSPGLANGRKLTKSLSEAANRAGGLQQDPLSSAMNFTFNNMPHEHLHRTFSEEPPRSPFETSLQGSNAFHVSRTPSRQSNFTETSRSDVMTSSHSRNPSAESGTSFRSTDFSSKDSVISFKLNAEIFDDFENLEAYEKPFYDSHSLPRKSCIHHRQQQSQQHQQTGQDHQHHTHSLPRRQETGHYHKQTCKHGQQTQATNISTEYLHRQRGVGMPEEEFGDVHQGVINYDPHLCRQQQQTNHHRRMSHSIGKAEMNAVLPRRNSVHQSSYQRPVFDDLISSRYVPSAPNVVQPDEEKEIFIDFKPRLSPPSPKSRKRGLLKTRSEGEILIDRRRESLVDAAVVCPTSQSEEDLIRPSHVHQMQLDIDEDRFRYQCVPIKDEGIFVEQNFFSPMSHHLGVTRANGGVRRDHFRKRSISLDEQQQQHQHQYSPTVDDSPEDLRECKSGCASTDSLSTKEQSESQITVLNNLERKQTMSCNVPANPGALSPTQQQQQRRKSMVQMKQEVDADRIDLDVDCQRRMSMSTQLMCSVGGKSGGGATNVVRPIKTPAVSVTPARSHGLGTGDEEGPTVNVVGTMRRPSGAPVKSLEASKYRSITAQEQDELRMTSSGGGRKVAPSTATVVVHHPRGADIDISECSTNTEDYLTCTENSKRTSQGIKPVGAISAATQVPVSSSASYRSAVATVDGSSFESASSIYGMPPPANLDAVLAAKAAAMVGTSSSVDEGGEVCDNNNNNGGAANKTKRMPAKPQSPSSTRSSSASSSSSSDTYNNQGGNVNMPTTIVTAATGAPTSSSGAVAGAALNSVGGVLVKELPSRMKGSPSRTNVVTPIMVKHVAKFESVSDDEDKTEIGNRAVASRRSLGKIDWNEEERRRRKGNLKLEFEMDAASGGGGAVSSAGKSMASPKTKISTTFKKISPDDRTALNILDGASPSKTKRFRPKTRRSPRNRSTSGGGVIGVGGEELVTPSSRRVKPTLATTSTTVAAAPSGVAQQTISTHQQPQGMGHTPTSAMVAPNNLISHGAVVLSGKSTPSKYPSSQLLATSMKPKHLSPSASPHKKSTRSGKSVTDLRLKALSTESLRSVSPGSDSVFYSEADLTLEHQVQCHHCGKDVDIVTAGPDSLDPMTDHSEADRPEIVQPPAGFADSPNGISKPRLYKKVDKRFRSEERHGDRRHHRNRSESRAKSEERGVKDDVQGSGSGGIRPAGSSPCVGVEEVQARDKFGQQTADPEQGIYHGLYRLGVWICIANQDVFRRCDLDNDRPYELNERRGSTDSEKDFRKKYQALTHRLVHRRSCIEMYKRQSGNTFNFSSHDNEGGGPEAETMRGRLQEIIRLMCMVWAKQGLANQLVSGGKKNATDKTVVVSRESGEFGFRIHGSKPVVVSAIEPDTPAESSGLEVGDIVLAVNGTAVIDKSHSEVVKIAHAGSDTLQLEVARTIDLLHPSSYDNTALYSGYLWRPCGYASGNPNTSKKWVRRWYTLRPDHCLYFYKSEHEQQPVGAILLTNHAVERCGGEVSKPFAFKIDDNENPIMYLAGDSEEATNRWVAVMSHAAKQMDPWLELSTKNLRLAPGDVPRPDCFGYLMKLGNRWRSWTKRYCVLKDACLYFYQDGNSRSAFGMTCLQGYRVQPSNNCGGKKFSFEISPPEPKLRHYYFSTESEMDKKRWIAALEYSIDRWMKAG